MLQKGACALKYNLISQPKPGYDIIQQILSNRGFDSVSMEHYLHTTDDDLNAPWLLDNIEEGLKVLVQHIANQDELFMTIDSDADGFTSAALFLNYLNCLFPAYVQNHVTYVLHEGKQHGIEYDKIPERTKLVVSIDAGSNETEIHEKLAAQGIDVLVLDHHHADIPKDTKAIIINNQTCNYPNKSLCGAAIVWKLCELIDMKMNVDYAYNYLDLVAVALISDVMDLRDFETRRLVDLGLKRITNPFLRELVNKNSYSIGNQLTPHGVAFYIGPYINAANRSGTQEEKLTLFESMLDFKGNELIPSTKRGCKGQMETRAEQACRNCTNIKSRQTKARDASLENIKGIIEEKHLLNNKILLVQTEGKSQNLIGLIANMLMSEYQHPVLLLNKRIHYNVDEATGEVLSEEVWWEGSGRNYGLDDFRHFVEETHLAQYCEGHASAFGCGIKDENIQKFIDYTNDLLQDYDFTPSYNVDAIFNVDTLNPDDVLSVGHFKYLWGQGIEEPYIAIENLKVSKSNMRLLKGNTLRIDMPNGISIIKFRLSSEEYEQLYSDLGYVIINAIGTCDINEWNDQQYPQIKLIDYEIVKKVEYDF